MKSKHQVNAAFSMSSMTDVIFLLLIFFMLTSNFVTPSGLPVNLPSSKGSNIELTKLTVTLTEDLRCYLNNQEVGINGLESALRKQLKGQEGLVSLHIDKAVPSEYLVRVAGIASSLKAKVSIVTIPE